MPLDSAGAATVRSCDLGKDYLAINRLFEAHDWHGGVPQACLPPTGFVAEHAGEIVAYSGVFLADGAAFALIAFSVVAPTLRGALRKEALHEVIKSAMTLGRSHAGPAGIVVSFTANAGLQAVFSQLGLRAGERNMSSFYLTDEPADFMTEDLPPSRP